MFWVFVLYFSLCLADEFLIERNQKIQGLDLEQIEREFKEQDRDIHRPCPTYDLLCIRRYLALHSKCKPTEGPVPDPLYQTQSNLYFPNVNISAIQDSLEISGLTGTVREFYVNRKADLTVFAVDFTNVTFTTKKTTIKYHRRGQEPIITSTTSDMELLPPFTTTTVFKGVDNLNLDDSETVAFINALPILNLGNELGISTEDPTIAARYTDFLASLSIIIQEAFLVEAPFYASMFIQYTLCDFKLFVS